MFFGGKKSIFVRNRGPTVCLGPNFPGTNLPRTVVTEDGDEGDEDEDLAGDDDG